MREDAHPGVPPQGVALGQRLRVGHIQHSARQLGWGGGGAAGRARGRVRRALGWNCGSSTAALAAAQAVQGGKREG